MKKKIIFSLISACFILLCVCVTAVNKDNISLNKQSIDTTQNFCDNQDFPDTESNTSLYSEKNTIDNTIQNNYYEDSTIRNNYKNSASEALNYNKPDNSTYNNKPDNSFNNISSNEDDDFWWEYIDRDPREIRILGCRKENPVHIDIPFSIKNYNVTEIASSAFLPQNTLKSVTLCKYNLISQVGENAFNAPNLKYVYMQSTLIATSIPDTAFPKDAFIITPQEEYKRVSEQYPNFNIYYELEKKAGDNLRVLYDKKDSILAIDGEGAMYDFSVNPAPWNDFKDNIKKIIFNCNNTKSILI